MFRLSGPLAAFVLLSALTLVTAQAGGFQCQKTWAGPSDGNDIAKCFADYFANGFPTVLFGAYGLVVAAAVLFIVMLIVFPVSFFWCACCQCCCDCCKEVPVETRNTTKYVRRLTCAFIIIAIVIAAASIIVFVIGANDINPASVKLVDDFDKDVVIFFSDTVNELERKVIDPSNGQYTAPFTNKTFSDVHDKLNMFGDIVTKIKDLVQQFAPIASYVGYGIAAIPMVLILFVALLEACNCRGCCPMFCSCIFWFILVLAAILATVLAAVSGVFADVQIEIELQKAGEPGLFQWYLVPVCDKAFNFTALKNDIAQQEQDFAQSFCGELLKHCSPSTVWNGSATDLFQCDLTNVSQCNNVTAAVAIFNATVSKVNSPACSSTCTFRQCPDVCFDPNLRNASAIAVKAADDATRLQGAFAFISPWLNCSALINQVLGVVAKNPKFGDDLLLLSIGFFLSAIVYLIGIYVLFRGAKIWFSQQEYKECDDAIAMADVDAVESTPGETIVETQTEQPTKTGDENVSNPLTVTKPVTEKVTDLEGNEDFVFE